MNAKLRLIYLAIQKNLGFYPNIAFFPYAPGFSRWGRRVFVKPVPYFRKNRIPRRSRRFV